MTKEELLNLLKGGEWNDVEFFISKLGTQDNDCQH